MSVIDPITVEVIGSATEPFFNDASLGGLSVACWVKGWPDGGWEPFVSKRGEGGQGWQLRRQGGGNNACFTLRGPGNDDNPGRNGNIGGQWNSVDETP